MSKWIKSYWWRQDSNEIYKGEVNKEIFPIACRYCRGAMDLDKKFIPIFKKDRSDATAYVLALFKFAFGKCKDIRSKDGKHFLYIPAVQEEPLPFPWTKTRSPRLGLKTKNKRGFSV